MTSGPSGLPQGFNEWEHLQSAVRRYHNKAVRDYFKNQPDNDISTPKRSLKHACILKDEDTVAMTQLRLWLFEVTVGHLESVQPGFYGTPVPEYQRIAKFKPQVRLVFKKDFDPLEDTEGYEPHESEICFRLMDEESDTISRNKAEILARDIRRVMATPLAVWEKGWYKTTYFDRDRGYHLNLLVKSRAEGERLVKLVLDIQNHPFERDAFQFIDHDRTYPINQGTHRVYGQTRRKPRKRPRVDVKFRYAQLRIWGRQKPVNLVSTSGRLRQVIERV